MSRRNRTRARAPAQHNCHMFRIHFSIFSFLHFSNFVFNSTGHLSMAVADVTHTHSSHIVSHLNFESQKSGEFGQQMWYRSRQLSSLIRFRFDCDEICSQCAAQRCSNSGHLGPTQNLIERQLNCVRGVRYGWRRYGYHIYLCFVFDCHQSRPHTWRKCGYAVFSVWAASLPFHNLFRFVRNNKIVKLYLSNRVASVNKKSYNWNRCPACAAQSPKHQEPMQFIAYLCACSRAQCQLRIAWHWLRLFCPRRRRWRKRGDQVVIWMQIRHTINKKWNAQTLDDRTSNSIDSNCYPRSRRNSKCSQLNWF